MPRKTVGGLGASVASIVAAAGCGGAILLAVAPDAEYRLFMMPILASVYIAGAFFLVLRLRDGRIPVFEVGSLLVASTLLYSVLPLLGFLENGLTWGGHPDNRLVAYNFDPAEITAFAWRYPVYLAAFVVTYLWRRGGGLGPPSEVKAPGRSTVAAFLVLLVSGLILKWVMSFGFGFRWAMSYSEMQDLVDRPANVPFLLLQVVSISFASTLLVKQGLLFALMCRWHERFWRWGLCLWLAVEVVAVVARIGARSDVVLLLLSAIMLYDRIVKPVRPLLLAFLGTAILVSFLFLGIVRGQRTFDLSVWNADPSAASLLSNNNEFTSLFVTAFDIHKRRETNSLGDVPWQIYASELYMVFPSQLLPFEKIDPSQWYLEVLGRRGTGEGYMFGVMAQAAVGLGWVEVIVRGIVLGLALSALHGWYSRQIGAFWPSLLYLFIAIWTYYMFRATTFYVLHFIVYQFLPVRFAVGILEKVPGTDRGRRPAPEAAGVL